MKPIKQNHLKGLPATTPCSGCGRQFANPRQSSCPVCTANFMAAVHLRLERAEEEKLKRLRLFQLRVALGRASRWLNGFDTTAIDQVIKAAAAGVADALIEEADRA